MTSRDKHNRPHPPPNTRVMSKEGSDQLNTVTAMSGVGGSLGFIAGYDCGATQATVEIAKWLSALGLKAEALELLRANENRGDQ